MAMGLRARWIWLRSFRRTPAAARRCSTWSANRFGCRAAGATSAWASRWRNSSPLPAARPPQTAKPLLAARALLTPCQQPVRLPRMTALSDAVKQSGDSDTFDSLSPATGERLASFPIASAADVEAAVARARSAFAWWGSLTYDERR